jgi:hypothetical protein
MRMSEFEKQGKAGDEDLPPLFIQGCITPDDFTGDDLAFAAVLGNLFSLEEEDLPPLYVQTLFAAEDQDLQEADPGFEQKTNAHVFRRLHLRRRLFCRPTSLLGAVRTNIREKLKHRSVMGALGAFALVMILTISFTGASFASGVAVLLHGANAAGVYLTDKYPTGMVHKNIPEGLSSSVNEIPLLTAQQQMYFPIYWPQDMPVPYSLKHVNLYSDLDQQWADGPMLELEYSLPPSPVAPLGTGEIWVREFKPRANVLQLVTKGASLPIQMNNSGQALAIYVNGQWVPHGREAPQWVYGERSELIYQVNGVVFWIVGDQRDGVGEQQLMQIAHGLEPHPRGQQLSYKLFHAPRQSPYVTELTEDLLGPFSNDVIVIFPGNGSEDPYYVSVSSYQPPKNGH